MSQFPIALLLVAVIAVAFAIAAVSLAPVIAIALTQRSADRQK